MLVLRPSKPPQPTREVDMQILEIILTIYTYLDSPLPLHSQLGLQLG